MFFSYQFTTNVHSSAVIYVLIFLYVSVQKSIAMKLYHIIHKYAAVLP